MKSKALILVSTVIMALALMAQSTPQNSTPTDNAAKPCACCNHDQSVDKGTSSGKDAKCCTGEAGCCKGGMCCNGKDGKACAMTSKNSNGKMSCCAEGKCPMASKKEAKGCCGLKMCARPEAGA